LECGDSSPLSQGDLSPSNRKVVPLLRSSAAGYLEGVERGRGALARSAAFTPLHRANYVGFQILSRSLGMSNGEAA